MAPTLSTSPPERSEGIARAKLKGVEARLHGVFSPPRRGPSTPFNCGRRGITCSRSRSAASVQGAISLPFRNIAPCPKGRSQTSTGTTSTARSDSRAQRGLSPAEAEVEGGRPRTCGGGRCRPAGCRPPHLRFGAGVAPACRRCFPEGHRDGVRHERWRSLGASLDGVEAEVASDRRTCEIGISPIRGLPPRPSTPAALWSFAGRVEGRPSFRARVP